MGPMGELAPLLIGTVASFNKFFTQLRFLISPFQISTRSNIFPSGTGVLRRDRVMDYFHWLQMGHSTILLTDASSLHNIIEKLNLLRIKRTHSVTSMGIKGLYDYLKKMHPQILRTPNYEQIKGQICAVDVSSCLYQFLAKTITYSKEKVSVPTDREGNQTGHLIGILYRSLFLMKLQVRPIWVFDNKPPIEKLTELRRRKAIKEQASQLVQKAIQAGDFAQIAKQKQKSIYISQTEMLDAMELIRAMGMPTLQAKTEAESQCAQLVKKNIAYAIIGEDADTLAFGGNRIIRGLSKDGDSVQIQLEEVLRALGLTIEEYVDACILMGCDYTSKITGIGPVKAVALIKEHHSIENVIRYILKNDKLRQRHEIPDDMNFLIARKLFLQPQVYSVKPEDIEQNPFEESKLKEFLLYKQFNVHRIEKWLQMRAQIMKGKDLSVSDENEMRRIF